MQEIPATHEASAMPCPARDFAWDGSRKLTVELGLFRTPWGETRKADGVARVNVFALTFKRSMKPSASTSVAAHLPAGDQMSLNCGRIATLVTKNPE